MVINHSDPFVVALVPAAGYSSRFGSDKRLATVGTGTLLEQTLAHTLPCYAQTVVVLRVDERELARQLQQHGYSVVHVDRAPEGLSSSIATGCEFILQHWPDCQAIAICLGDMPFITPSIHKQLLEQADENCIVRPVYNDTPGHPVIFGRDYFPELATLLGDSGARAILEKHPSALRECTFKDNVVIRDVDSPADIS